MYLFDAPSDIAVGIIILAACPGGPTSNMISHLAKPVKIGSGIVLALIIIGITLKEKENFVSYFQQAGIIALFLNVGSVGVGMLLAYFFRLSRPQARSISIESGIQNGTMAIAIATVLLANPAFAIAPAVYSLIMFASGAAVIYLGNKIPERATTMG